MTVIAIEKATPSLRGKLTRWFIEISRGIYVGTVSSIVRTEIWNLVQDSSATGALIYSSNNEQGYEIQVTGNPHKTVVDFDGLKLIKTMNR